MRLSTGTRTYVAMVAGMLQMPLAVPKSLSTKPVDAKPGSDVSTLFGIVVVTGVVMS